MSSSSISLLIVFKVKTSHCMEDFSSGETVRRSRVEIKT